MVEKIRFVCVWVQQVHSVVVGSPEDLRDLLIDLNLL